MSYSSIDQLIRENKTCLRCLNRCLSDESNNEVNAEIRNKLVDELDCDFCEGIVIKCLNKIPSILKKIEDKEFETFLVGIQMTNKLLDHEKIFKNYKLEPSSLKTELSKEISNNLKTHLNKEIKFVNPDITITFRTSNNPRYEISIKSLYLLGRYNKLERGIPQTKWPCTYCKGKKCEKCSFTGQQYPFTVEGIIAKPFLIRTNSTGSSFHGAGREDIDALMLGQGRPFVLELKNPKFRYFNVREITDQVNKSSKVKINSLSFCEKLIIKKIKEESSKTKKSYRALIELEKPAKQSDLDNLILIGKTSFKINQFTPTRVSHRRANIMRVKKVFKFNIENKDSNHFEITITTQGGTYIKEFISGDNGNTKPSISEILGINCKCIELDVLEVDQKNLFSETMLE